MPVPWPRRAVVPRIEQVEHRAVTIQQLRNLRLFLQRLCKSGLLRSKFRGNARINWFEINMFDIRDCVILPLIRHLERARNNEWNGGYSWAELVAEDPEQPPDLLLSHSWSGRFVDFMMAVDKLAARARLGADHKIWICTFGVSRLALCHRLSVCKCCAEQSIRRGLWEHN